jgi:hypothetical protein
MAGPDKQHWYSRTPPTPVVPQDDFARGKHRWEEMGRVLGGWPQRQRTVGALLLREDGWAALRPTYEHGEVITRQFVFEGDKLFVNADCSGGYLRVEILDPSFKPYPGFEAAACVPVTGGDTIWHEVVWQGANGDRADLRALWDQPVRLRIELHQAALYAFQFRGE